MVYPLGLEPKLDGVGGRNVIQLHYEYLFIVLFLNPGLALRQKKLDFSTTLVERIFIQLHYEYELFFIFLKNVSIFYYFLLPFCKRLWYNISKFN